MSTLRLLNLKAGVDPERGFSTRHSKTGLGGGERVNMDFRYKVMLHSFVKLIGSDWDGRGIPARSGT